MTIVRKLLDHITFTLNMDSKTIFHINDEYFLKKEQKEKDEFAIEFAKYISKNGKIPLHKRDDRIPEYSNMSKGMGLQYITENMKAWHLNGLRLYVVMEDGKKLSLPRYFRDKIFNKEQLEEAKNNISSKQDEYTPAYIESQFKKQSKDAKNRKL